MRLLAKISIPLEDEVLQDGSVPLKVRLAMQTLRPESAYFVQDAGKCECFFVFNLDFVSLLQPLFPGLDASFQVTPVMNAAEFDKSLGGTPPKQQVVGDSDLVTDLRREAKPTPGANEPGDGEPRVTPLGDETAKKR